MSIFSWLIGLVIFCMLLCGYIYFEEEKLSLADIINCILLSLISSWIGLIIFIIISVCFYCVDWITLKYDDIILFKKKN
jgi:hypothetical protein